MTIDSAANRLAAHGVAYAPSIAKAAQRHGIDPSLLAAVAAQETGGPGSNAGRNIVGDGGHGHGLFQIDDRSHAFATSSQSMDPDANADYAAGILSGLLSRYGGNVHEALSAYNTGRPDWTGTKTTWADGSQLGYADSVLRHQAQLSGPSQSVAAPQLAAASMTGTLESEGSGESAASSATAELSGLISSLGSLSAQAGQLPNPPALPSVSQQPQSYQRAMTDYMGLVDGDGDND